MPVSEMHDLVNIIHDILDMAVVNELVMQLIF